MLEVKDVKGIQVKVPPDHKILAYVAVTDQGVFRGMADMSVELMYDKVMDLFKEAQKLREDAATKSAELMAGNLEKAIEFVNFLKKRNEDKNK